MSAETISILIFFGILGFLIFKDRKNIEFKYVLLTRRTDTGKDKIKELGEKYSKLFKTYSNIAIVVAIITSVIGMYFLISLIETGEPTIKLLFPKVFPGEPSQKVERHVMFIPLWYWVITIFIIIVPHELSHGLVAAAEKIRIKSLGVLLLLIFPGAFVEPDEEQFKRSKPKTRMRVAAVGSIANFLVVILLAGLLLGLNLISNAVFMEVGVSFSETIPGTPAHEVGLKGVITGINGEEIRELNDLLLVMENVKPGEEITVRTSEDVFSIKTISNPQGQGKSYIGINNLKTALKYKGFMKSFGDPNIGSSIYVWFWGLFNWAILLNLAVGTVNLLPILPFDGGIISEALLEKFFKKKIANKIAIGISILTGILIIINMIGTNTIISKVKLLLGLI